MTEITTQTNILSILPLLTTHFDYNMGSAEQRLSFCILYQYTFHCIMYTRTFANCAHFDNLLWVLHVELLDSGIQTKHPGSELNNLRSATLAYFCAFILNASLISTQSTIHDFKTNTSLHELSCIFLSTDRVLMRTDFFIHYCARVFTSLKLCANYWFIILDTDHFLVSTQISAANK
jgi:hypothetical protein